MRYEKQLTKTREATETRMRSNRDRYEKQQRDVRSNEKRLKNQALDVGEINKRAKSNRSNRDEHVKKVPEIHKKNAISNRDMRSNR
jgi:hypothetical protein